MPPVQRPAAPAPPRRREATARQPRDGRWRRIPPLEPRVRAVGRHAGIDARWGRAHRLRAPHARALVSLANEASAGGAGAATGRMRVAAPHAPGTHRRRNRRAAALARRARERRGCARECTHRWPWARIRGWWRRSRWIPSFSPAAAAAGYRPRSSGDDHRVHGPGPPAVGEGRHRHQVAACRGPNAIGTTIEKLRKTRAQAARRRRICRPETDRTVRISQRRIQSISMLRFLSAGESHGQALVITLDGMPAGLDLDIDALNAQLRRRQGGYDRGRPIAIYSDQPELLAS